MEINRRYIIEQPLSILGYELQPVSQVYSSLYIGKAGIYAFSDKRPLLVMMKTPAGERRLLNLEGKLLTRAEAVRIAPVLDDLLDPEF
jgi:hypothetical protein